MSFAPHPSPLRSDLLTTVLQRGLHFSHWDTTMLVAWLEVWVGVPYWYIAAIRNCITNGATLNVSGLFMHLQCTCTCTCTCLLYLRPWFKWNTCTCHHIVAYVLDTCMYVRKCTRTWRKTPSLRPSLQSLTEAELEKEFGITNSLHRLKIRLAVQEMVSLTSTTTPHLARTVSTCVWRMGTVHDV